MSEQTWRFSLPNVDGQGWAIVFMDSAGCFAALSDYGDVLYRWWSAKSLPHAFLSFGDSYLLDKFSFAKKVYDPKSSLAAVREFLLEEKKLVLEERRGSVMTKAEASKRWMLLNDEEESIRLYDELDTEAAFVRWTEYSELDDPNEFYMVGPDDDVRAFVKNIVPRLKALLIEQGFGPEEPAPPVVSTLVVVHPEPPK